MVCASVFELYGVRRQTHHMTQLTPAGFSSVVSPQRSGSPVLMWVMRCGLTFEILSLLPNSIWLVCITLVWAVRGPVMGVGTRMVMSFDWLQGPGSLGR